MFGKLGKCAPHAVTHPKSSVTLEALLDCARYGVNQPLLDSGQVVVKSGSACYVATIFGPARTLNHLRLDKFTVDNLHALCALPCDPVTVYSKVTCPVDAT